MPDYFLELQHTYKDRPLVTCANVAITEHNGTVMMHRVDPAAVEEGHVPRWAKGASSLYQDRTALCWADIKPYLTTIEVPCLTLHSLLSYYGVERIDVLQIDAEGYDYHILRQIDWTHHRPRLINFEIVNLPENEQKEAQSLLAQQGYVFEKTGYDLVARRRDDP